MSVIGIVGGVGPLAGNELFKRITEETLAEKDQDHISVVLISKPSEISDRTDYLIGKTQINPAFSISKIIQELNELNAIIIGIPCITAHSKKIYNQILRSFSEEKNRITIVNMLEELKVYINSEFENDKIGILSTFGSFKTKLFSEYLDSSQLLYLEQKDALKLHSAIYDNVFGLKSTLPKIHPTATRIFQSSIYKLKEKGATKFLLGCTELSSIPSEIINNFQTIDPLKVFARSLIKKVNANKLKSHDI